jgi:hypothetical protein
MSYARQPDFHNVLMFSLNRPILLVSMGAGDMMGNANAVKKKEFRD